jgi:hypothetical protein
VVGFGVRSDVLATKVQVRILLRNVSNPELRPRGLLLLGPGKLFGRDLVSEWSSLFLRCKLDRVVTRKEPCMLQLLLCQNLARGRR